MTKRFYIIFLISFFMQYCRAQTNNMVVVKGGQFFLNQQPYYYIGANYWYGGLLGLEKDKNKGFDRLRKELDFLTSKGINNLRVLAVAEGTGLINGVQRVAPAFQSARGIFTIDHLKGLDLLLTEMGKRKMKAILYLSNNWEWSGGFLQYLNWNGLIPDSILRRKLSWDEMRDQVSKFYTCNACIEDYKKQVSLVVTHINFITGIKYIDDPAIMAWELANEPRPMRSTANEAYKNWITSMAAFIRSKDKNHLITTGTEGEMGTENISLYEQIHANENVDYLTIHIWPKNWSWFKDTSIDKDLPLVISKTRDYIQRHLEVAKKINKPLVIEEFGLPRDKHSFDVTSPASLRNKYYDAIFSTLQQHASRHGLLAGVNFWGFGGMARPHEGQIFWKEGDDYMADPPMEEQGLNTVFDSDKSTFDLIYSFTATLKNPSFAEILPSDKKATTETVTLYKNLKALMNKGVMFGHQDDLAYGVGWRYIPGKSDVKELTGEYPAVYGWELGHIEHNIPYNLDSVPFDKMHEFIKSGFERGGVITISWHADNPLTGGSAWDTTYGAVQSILPGGIRHELYKSWLDNVATFLKELNNKSGISIPILFRPFHEFTGNWFWWGKNKCTPAEFKLLWRFTVDYLRNVKGLHHLLYVYNTADFNSREDFMERYPGDDVVDVLSFDSYQSNDPQKDSSFIKKTDQRLGIVEKVALERGKIPALAETGYERIPYAEWWTKTLWTAIADHRISYVLVWRNHGLQQNGNWHYYVPPKAHVSSADFKKFYNLDRTLFEKDVAKEKLYNAR